MIDQVGVLVLSYGTPESLAKVEPYYTHIRRGRPPSTEQLQDLTDRYKAIAGGIFPLRQHTNDQVNALQQALQRDDRTQGTLFHCYQGLKHTYPFVEDGVNDMHTAGIKQAIALVLAPHYSTMSVGSYMKRAEQQAQQTGITIHPIFSYHMHPKLLRALSSRLCAKLDEFKAMGVSREQVTVLFTAHSLPEKILQMKDPYVDQLLETSYALAAQASLECWQFTWQSAGRTAEPWLGPDILHTLEQLHEQGKQYVLVVPIGFVCDHLEILYDLDIEAMSFAKERGMCLMRTVSLNSDPLYIEALRDIIIDEWERQQTC